MNEYCSQSKKKHEEINILNLRIHKWNFSHGDSCIAFAKSFTSISLIEVSWNQIKAFCSRLFKTRNKQESQDVSNKYPNHVTSVQSVIQHQPIHQLQSFRWSLTGKEKIVKEERPPPHSNVYGKHYQTPAKFDITSRQKWQTDRRIVRSRPTEDPYVLTMLPPVNCCCKTQQYCRSSNKTYDQNITSQHRKQEYLDTFISNTVTSYLMIITLVNHLQQGSVGIVK